MSLPIFKGYPHTTSILRANGIERVLDYHPVHKPTPDLTYARAFITPECGGIYLKWLNRYAGYNYWLFSEVFTETLTVKSRGRIVNNWTQRANAKSQFNNIGMESTSGIKIYTKAIHDYMKDIIGVVESPEIYLYTGDGGHDKYNIQYCGWLRVTVSDGTYTSRNSKNSNQELRLNVAFPERSIQSIV